MAAPMRRFLVALALLAAAAARAGADPVTIVDTTPGTATRDGVIGVGEYVGFSTGINSGFGNIIGDSSAIFLDSSVDGRLNIGLRSGGGQLLDGAVIYIDTDGVGLSTTTSGFTDFADPLRRAISGFNGTDRSVLEFGGTFSPAFAIGIESGFAGAWQLVNGGSHTYLATGDLTPLSSPDAGDWEAEFQLSTFGLEPGDSFRYVVTYLNMETVFRSDEFHGVAQSTVPPGNPGWTTVFLAATDYNVFQTVPRWVEIPGPWSTDSVSTHGIAFGDINGDEWEDLYLARSGPNLLLLNNGDGTFIDYTDKITANGVNGQGVTFGDADNDGDGDIYLANVSGAPNILFLNDGSGSYLFSGSGPLGDTGNGVGAAFGDVDNDGDLDIYLANYNGFNVLMRNDGGNTYVNATFGPLGYFGSSTAATFGDIDDDGDLDLYVSVLDNANILLRNDGGGTFVDISSGDAADAGSDASATFGDVDNDGDLDLYLVKVGITSFAGPRNGIPTFPENVLLINDGAGNFTASTPAPLNDPGEGAAAAFADVDNDGDLDLYVANADTTNKLFRNEGDGSWVDATPPAIEDPGQSTAAAFADTDNDGDLDLYVADAGTCRYFRNVGESFGNHWLHFDLRGVYSNRSAIGARVRVVAASKSQIREVSGGVGDAQNSLRVAFGLGASSIADSVIVRWPSGIVQVLTAVEADQRIVLVESAIPLELDVDGFGAPAGETQFGFQRLTSPALTGDFGDGTFALTWAVGSLHVRVDADGAWSDVGVPPTFQSLPQVMRDMVAAKGVANAEVTVAVIGLPAGTYRVTSYHQDWTSWDTPLPYDILVDDAMGFGRLVVNDAVTLPDVDHTGVSYDVVSNGVDSLIIHMREDNSGDVVFFNGITIAEAVPPKVTGVMPASGSNTGPVTLDVAGQSLPPGSVLMLARTSTPDTLNAGPAAVRPDGLGLTATVDLTGAATGAWDVVVWTPSGFLSLAAAFTVEKAAPHQLRVDVVGPPVIRPERRKAYDVVIENLGNGDALAVPLWVGGLPAGATVEPDFTLAAPPQAGGEPDWSLAPQSFTAPPGGTLVMVLPHLSPGINVRRLYLTVPSGVTEFTLDAALAPPWVNGSALAGCLAGGGVITNAACMGAQLDAINAAITATPGLPAVNAIGLWAKVAWQCEGAGSLPAAVAAAEQVLGFMLQSITAPPPAGCLTALGPHWRQQRTVTVVSSVDPNEKIGTPGVGPDQSIGGTQILPYSIRFENLETATAPAQEVVVIDQLDAGTLDLNTLSVNQITFGDRVVLPPPGLRNFTIDVNLPEEHLIVRVAVTFDLLTGRLSWALRSLDPTTGQIPDNPLVGFLPPNVIPPQGEGSVLFTVFPKPALPGGTDISNAATIVFDGVALDTPPWSNRMDTTAPQSEVLPLPAVDSTTFTVHWQAVDEPADLLDFSVYTSEDGKPFRPWRLHTTATADTFVASPGASYAFYSLARDSSGNLEAAPPIADAQTFSGVSVGGGPGLALALQGAIPNPVTDVARVWFVLPVRGKAMLEVMDVAGRRTLQHEVGHLGPGRHVLDVGAGIARPGIYFLRLTQGDQVRRARMVVLRP